MRTRYQGRCPVTSNSFVNVLPFALPKRLGAWGGQGGETVTRFDLSSHQTQRAGEPGSRLGTVVSAGPACLRHPNQPQIPSSFLLPGCLHNFEHERTDGFEPSTSWRGWRHALCQLSYVRRIPPPQTYCSSVSISLPVAGINRTGAEGTVICALPCHVLKISVPRVCRSATHQRLAPRITLIMSWTDAQKTRRLLRCNGLHAMSCYAHRRVVHYSVINVQSVNKFLRTSFSQFDFDIVRCIADPVQSQRQFQAGDHLAFFKRLEHRLDLLLDLHR